MSIKITVNVDSETNQPQTASHGRTRTCNQQLSYSPKPIGRWWTLLAFSTTAEFTGLFHSTVTFNNKLSFAWITVGSILTEWWLFLRAKCTLVVVGWTTNLGPREVRTTSLPKVPRLGSWSMSPGDSKQSWRPNVAIAAKMTFRSGWYQESGVHTRSRVRPVTKCRNLHALKSQVTPILPS